MKKKKKKKKKKRVSLLSEYDCFQNVNLFIFQMEFRTNPIVVWSYFQPGIVQNTTKEATKKRQQLRSTNEPAHDKTYRKTFVTRKDSEQPVHPSSMAKVYVYPSSDRLEAVEGTCDQRRLWTARMRRLIWVFARRTRFVVRWL